ncbi:MAG: serine/threonine-protein kinase [Gemmatimonadales bacterium]|nr:serine/threonine-protein kinase [Gemmatimonadales bacterium]
MTLDALTAALSDRYRLERELGAGGMATVYLAQDLKHDRQVAIKVLHPDLGAALGGERFLAEIRTTARLQHPHILPLLDSGDAGGLLYYVMPLVTGETLRTRLERERQLPIADAVRIAREVASALDYAHRQGVIHRDIKPENILLHDGQALVADFGIALAVQSAGGERMTQTGLSLGTPQYMSPEQAMGEKQIDARSDVYALAAVTYEMLAGDAPFTGGSVQAIVAKIMTEKPTPLHTLRDTVPPHVEAAVLTGLAKLPADRHATAAEFATALVTTTGVHAPPHGAARSGPFGLSARAAAGIMAGLAVVTVGAVAAALTGRGNRDAPPRVARFEVTMAPDEALATPGGTRFAWSPDGTMFVYTGTGSAGNNLWSRSLDALVPVPLRGSERATSPTFSPDGREIAFVTTAPFSIRVMPRTGGTARVVAEGQNAAGGGVAWSEDGFLYFDGGTGLARVRPDGSEHEMVMPLDTARGEIGMAWPRVLPEGRGILMRIRRAGEAMTDWSIIAFDPQARVRRDLVRGVFAIYSPTTGHLLWVTGDGTLMAQALDLDQLTLRGEPTRLWDNIYLGGFGAADVVLSSSGDLLYMAGSGTETSIGSLAWVDRRGRSTIVDSTGINGLVRALALAPDGRSAALSLERATDATNLSRIWIAPLGGGPLQLVTTEDKPVTLPTWESDSRSLLYVSDQGTTIYRRRTDGGGVPEAVATVSRGIVGMTVDPTGRSLVLIGEDSGERRRELLNLRLTGDRTPTVLPVPIGTNREPPVLSPDGRWLAYVSPLGGREDVYVSPYPDITAGRVQVSASGGGAPRWNRQGGELFYVNDAGAIVSVRFATTDGFRILSTEELFTPSGFRGGDGRVYYDPAPDGERFLMVDIGAQGRGRGAAGPILVQHFTTELQARVAP